MISFMTALSTGAFTMLFGIVVLQLGRSEGFLGEILAIGLLATGAFSLPVGILADLWGKKRTLLLALGFTGAGLLGQATLPLGNLTLGFSILFGTGQAMLGVVTLPILMENSVPKNQTQLFSLNFAITMVAQVLGSLIAGKAPDLVSSQRALIGFALLQVIAFGIALFWLMEKKVCLKIQPSLWYNLKNYSKLLSTSELVKNVFIYNALIGFGAGLVIPFFNIFLTQRLKAPTIMVGIVMSVSQVGMALAGLLAPFLILKLGKVKSVVFSQLLSIPFLLMIALPQSLWVVILSFLLRSALMNMSNPISSSFTMEITPIKQRATITSLIGMSQNLSRAGSATIGGWLMEKTNYSVPYFVTAILYLFASIYYKRAFTPREQELSSVKRIE
ncbi:MAG: MFS transporter [Bacillota bacterium]|nr:MFS transporter [Bacillota bacterium]